MSSATTGRHGAPAKTRTRETVAEYARDIHVNECEGCWVHQNRNTIDKQNRECRIPELDKVAQRAVDTP